MIVSHPDIITNKYYNLYMKIVDSSDLIGYTETHHILPVSMGGTNDKSNLISFSARKHFLAHYLLTKFVKYKSTSWYSMVKAFNMMGCESNAQQRYINSRLYESNRKHMSEVMRESSKGKKNSQYGTKWMYNAELDESRKFSLNEFDYMLSQGWLFGRRSKSYIENLTIANKGKLTTSQVLGKTIKIYKNGIIIQTRELHYYRDYLLDGWKLFPKISDKPTNKGGVKIKSKHSLNNLLISEEISLDFIKSGLWEYGFHNPNHKGTTGKKYKIIDGVRFYQ